MADRKDDIRTRLLATFRVEAEEHLQALTTNLVALEHELPVATTRELIEATFREMHTLKGAARSVSLMDVEVLCQACESLLSRVNRGDLALSRTIVGRLQEAVDVVARLLTGAVGPAAVREMVTRLDDAPAESAGESDHTRLMSADRSIAAEPASAMSSDTVRLATAKLDALLLRAEDLLVPKLAAEERVKEARVLVEALWRWRTALNRSRPLEPAQTGNGRAPSLSAALDSDLRALEGQARGMLGRLTRDQLTIATVVDGLQEEMRQTRMMPAASVLDLFPRMVRDLAGEQGKEVDWVADGAAMEMDRRVLEQMKDPLIHLVRNAIDHGIEPPEARQQTGKPRRGRVKVTIAAAEGGRLEICVEDDGRGLDLGRVREAAVRARLLSPEAAQALMDEAALDLVYRSGVSTSPIITDVSGHGLGLAIVKEHVERLGGQIRLATGAGTGTAVRMTLPATVVTFRGLLVQAGGQLFLLPTDAVERAIRVAREEIQGVEGREVICRNGHPLPVLALSRLLRLPERESEPAGSKISCVVVRTGEERVGLLIEGLLGSREVLVKELRPPLVRVKNVSAAGLLGTGQVVLILRPADLLKSIHEAPRPTAPAAAREEAKRPKVILVVDDSITTRTMERNLLEAAGYQVRVAVDGIEAWTLLRSEAFDLVVSDVDMPRMDGLDLTARIRADRKLGELPVVLVTALESREDKERGIEVGANAYLVKSSFDQSNLLDIIRRLL